MDKKFANPKGSKWKRAAELRFSLTPAERKLWRFLKAKQLGVQFIPQRPIGPYIVDFCATKENLIIELDGETHASDEAQEYDKTRTEYLENLGWRIVRYTNQDVLKGLDNVIADIQTHLKK